MARCSGREGSGATTEEAKQARIIHGSGSPVSGMAALDWVRATSMQWMQPRRSARHGAVHDAVLGEGRVVFLSWSGHQCSRRRGARGWLGQSQLGGGGGGGACRLPLAPRLLLMTGPLQPWQRLTARKVAGNLGGGGECVWT